MKTNILKSGENFLKNGEPMSDDKVVRLTSIKNINPDLITPETLLELVNEEMEEIQPEKAFVILTDKDGYRYYTAGMKDEELITIFESIKLFLIANKFGGIESEEP